MAAAYLPPHLNHHQVRRSLMGMVRAGTIIGDLNCCGGSKKKRLEEFVEKYELDDIGTARDPTSLREARRRHNHGLRALCRRLSTIVKEPFYTALHARLRLLIMNGTASINLFYHMHLRCPVGVEGDSESHFLDTVTVEIRTQPCLAPPDAGGNMNSVVQQKYW